MGVRVLRNPRREVCKYEYKYETERVDIKQISRIVLL
jgi:hypothetical protein